MKKKQLITQVNNLLNKEFKALLIRMLIGLGKRTDEHSENFNKELKKKSELNTITSEKIQQKEITDLVIQKNTFKWHGRQNNRNHPIRRRKRKTNFKKWDEFKGPLGQHQTY